MLVEKAGKLLLASLLLFYILTPTARAGFGISPPYFTNESLARGSYYEKKIILVRGDPTEDLKAELTFDVEGANDWITIDKGREFLLPKGEKQIPMMVRVDIPKDAKFGNYKGAIRITTSPVKEAEAGTVAILLGTQIEVDLTVGENEIIDFNVKGIKTKDLEEGHKFLWMNFPAKITFFMKIENIGNVPAGPSRVVFDIYDSQEENLLRSIEATEIGKVNPFETDETSAVLLTDLEAGTYSVVYKIFKEEEIISEGKTTLSILPYGTIPDYVGASFFDLPLKEQLPLYIGIFLIFALIIFALVRAIHRKRRTVKIKK